MRLSIPLNLLVSFVFDTAELSCITGVELIWTSCTKRLFCIYMAAVSIPFSCIIFLLHRCMYSLNSDEIKQ
jgi:hypothetical protein